MAKRRFSAMAQAIAMAAEHVKERAPRREIGRCIGKWRGSTIAGYLRSPYDSVYMDNFRMIKSTFNKLLSLLKSGGFGNDVEPIIKVAGKRVGERRGATHIAYARAHIDPPTVRFKTAVCLYAMAQGGRFKVIADAAGIGVSTVRKWMVGFCAAITKAVKPIYMPVTPHTPEERAAIRDKFASRRGFPNAALACDGTHVPYHPRGGKKAKNLYRNYKGWTFGFSHGQGEPALLGSGCERCRCYLHH